MMMILLMMIVVAIMHDTDVDNFDRAHDIYTFIKSAFIVFFLIPH